MAYDYSNAPAKYLREIEITNTPDPFPPEHARENNVTARWRIALPDDDIELYVKRQKGAQR